MTELMPTPLRSSSQSLAKTFAIAARLLESPHAGGRPERGQSRRARTARSDPLRRPFAGRARDADLPVGVAARLLRPLPPDEQRGRVRGVVPRCPRRRRRRHRQPWGVVALLLRDPRRSRAPAGADRRGAPLGRGEARGLAPALRDRQPGREADRRQGPRRLPRGARVHRARAQREVNGRIERLRAMLEEPLLVTDATNLYYLTGFKSSNAALLVEPNRLRLFADFRYATAARAVDGVEFEENERALLAGVARRIEGRVAFEAAAVSYDGYETLRGGGLGLVPTTGVVEGLRAVKDEQELAAIRAACEITDRVYERLADERFVGRTERDLAWVVAELFH